MHSLTQAFVKEYIKIISSRLRIPLLHFFPHKIIILFHFFPHKIIINFCSGWNRGSDNNLKNVQLVHGSAKSKPKPRKKTTKPAQPLAEEITVKNLS